MQAALSLGAFPNDRALPILVNLLGQHYEDHWMRLAILSSEVGSSMALLERLQAQSFFNEVHEEKNKFIADFAHVIGSSTVPSEVVKLLKSLRQMPAPFALGGCQGLSRGLKKSENEIETSLNDRIASLAEEDEAEIMMTVDVLLDYFSSTENNI
jgi:hypothetical protein